MNVFKSVVTTIQSKVVGSRVHRGRREGNAWTAEIMEVIKGKKRVYEML